MALSSSSRKVVVGIVILLASAVLVVGVGFWWVNNQIAGTPGSGDPVQFEVKEGASASSIGEALAARDVIGNSLAFRLVARSRGLDANIRTGVYDLETGMSVDEAIAAIQAGPQPLETLRITIPEGLTVAQTLDRLARDTPYSVDQFRAALDATRQDRAAGGLTVPDWVPSFDSFSPDIEVFEGLLYPQTYDFKPDVTVTEILQRLLNQTGIAMASAPPTAVQAAAAAGVDRYQALIAASLIEREARVPGEWDQIAAVIRNRLDASMALQIDATLLYAAGVPGGGPSAVDPGIDSPYNTYQQPGLPPTPIAGARPEAIRAVFTPADEPYLYYVVSPACDGSHQFATTLDEHNANVQAYREAGRCQ